MKKLLLLALLLIPAPAMAEDAAKTPDAPPPHEGAMKGKNFEERKAEILKRMDKRLEEAKKRHACVEAAKDPEALRACMPERMKNRKRHEEHDAGDAPEQQ